MAKQEITCMSYIRGADGELVEFSTLSAEQKQSVRDRIAENVGRVIGQYLTEHPEEIDPLSRCNGVSLIPET